MLKKLQRLSKLYLYNIPGDKLQRLACRFGLETKPKVKVFGIGRNKTGTTSLQDGLTALGYRVAPTKKGEFLLEDWAKGNFRSILSLSREYNAFQDVPFNLPGTFEVVDKEFPGSKFVLTVRDSAEQWFNSLLKFHSKIFGNGEIPTWEDLENSTYRKKGFIAFEERAVYQADIHGLYNREAYIDHYQKYNAAVRDYFSNRPNDFLEINIAEPDSFKKLCEFLGVESNDLSEFPWSNRT